MNPNYCPPSAHQHRVPRDSPSLTLKTLMAVSMRLDQSHQTSQSPVGPVWVLWTLRLPGPRPQGRTAQYLESKGFGWLLEEEEEQEEEEGEKKPLL